MAAAFLALAVAVSHLAAVGQSGFGPSQAFATVHARADVTVVADALLRALRPRQIKHACIAIGRDGGGRVYALPRALSTLAPCALAPEAPAYAGVPHDADHFTVGLLIDESHLIAHRVGTSLQLDIFTCGATRASAGLERVLARLQAHGVGVALGSCAQTERARFTQLPSTERMPVIHRHSAQGGAHALLDCTGLFGLGSPGGGSGDSGSGGSHGLAESDGGLRAAAHGQATLALIRRAVSPHARVVHAQLVSLPRDGDDSPPGFTLLLLLALGDAGTGDGAELAVGGAGHGMHGCRATRAHVTAHAYTDTGMLAIDIFAVTPGGGRADEAMPVARRTSQAAAPVVDVATGAWADHVAARIEAELLRAYNDMPSRPSAFAASGTAERAAISKRCRTLDC